MVRSYGTDCPCFSRREFLIIAFFWWSIMPKAVKKQCTRCGARCCQYFSFEIDKPDTYEQFESIRWYLLHEGISVYIDDEGDWCILIDNLCRMLVKRREGGRCKQYDNRPLICRKYSSDRCDYIRGGYDWEEVFRSADELEAYARRMLGEQAFEDARAAAHKAIADSQRKKAPRKTARRIQKGQPAGRNRKSKK